MGYELHIEGRVIKDASLEYLRKTAHLMSVPYVIYKIFKSRLHEVVVRKKEISGNKMGLSDYDMREIKRQRDRGYSTSVLSKKYSMTVAAINEVLRDQLIKPE